MSPYHRPWDEEKLSEKPAVELLEHLGYSYIKAETLEAERQSLKEVVLTTRLHTALRRLNPWLSESNATKAVKAITHVSAASLAEANEELHTALTYGISLKQDRGRGKKSQTVHFIDYDNPRNNDFIVTRQYKVLGTKKHIIPDIVCFVNGIPFVVIECKSPTRGDKWKAEGINQIHRYQEADSIWKGQGAPKLFEPAQIVVATCDQAAVYGTVGTLKRFFFEWKVPYPINEKELKKEIGRAPTAQGILIYGLLSPENLLDVVRNFVVFDVVDGRAIRKVCRYKQFVAVNNAMERIRASKKPTERGGVVWHTQGSGKSLTMLWLALKLRRDPALKNPTIAIVTDRTKLDKQIADTFVSCGFPNPEQAKSVRNLREILTHPTGKTVMTTIQKFQEVTAGHFGKGGRSSREAHPTLSKADNIFVMVDEAHRTQYKSLAANMRKALPNACFLGFTGTPIDKRDKSTIQTFGPYIDTYTIEQAVKDKATVPIFYEGRLPEIQIIGQNLDKLFDHVFSDRSKEERAAIKKKYATEEAIAGAPRRIETICLDLLKHFRAFIHPNGFKAQVVAVSRLTAVTYKETLDRLNAPDSALLMSAGHNDEERLARHHLPREQQDRLIERFKDKSDPLSILIVCDMLLTGFDAPVEQVMYLDSPLKEHTLLQAIARVNRTANKKDYGLVVDYWGIAKALKEALKIFSSIDVKGALVPKTDELPRLQTRHNAAMRFFQKVKDKGDLNACILVLEPEDVRTEFDETFRRFSQSMDMLLPDPRALDYVKDLRWLGKIRQAARARYHDGRLDISDCGAKVRQLIDEAVSADNIEILVKEVPLFTPEFDEKIKKLDSDEARASEMEHALRHEIHTKLEENPAFYLSLRERLKEIVDQWKKRRIEAAKQLELLEVLKAEMGQEQQTAQEIGLSRTGFAIYGLLEDARPAVAAEKEAKYNAANVDLASLIDEAVEPFTQLVDWTQKEDIQRKMRSQIKRQLRAAGIGGDAVNTLALGIVDLAKARQGK